MGLHEQGMIPKSSPIISYLFPCCLHGSLAAAILFIHRALFWNVNVLFDGPLSLSLAECFITTLVCALRLRSSNFSLVHCVRNGFMSTIHDQSLSIKIPFIFGFFIGFNNLCLYYMDLSMYFVARAFIIPFSIILTYKCQPLLNLWKLFVAAAFIVIGYIITLIEQNYTNLLIAEGVVFGLFSALFGSLFMCEMRKMEDTSAETQLKQVYLNNIISCCLLFVSVVFTERSEFRYLPVNFVTDTFLFWFLVIVACVASSFVGQCKVNALTSCPRHLRGLFSLGRSLLQTMIAIFVYHVYTTILWKVGVLLIAIGYVLYWMTNRKTPDVILGSDGKGDASTLSATH